MRAPWGTSSCDGWTEIESGADTETAAAADADTDSGRGVIQIERQALDSAISISRHARAQYDGSQFRGDRLLRLGSGSEQLQGGELAWNCAGGRSRRFYFVADRSR